MRLGLIARADNGGLGTQTWEYHRHLRPDATLVVDLGSAGRGPADPSRFSSGALRVCANPPSAEDIAWLVERCDVVLSAEGAYNDDLWRIAAEAGTATVLHANPELWRIGAYRPSVTVTPTNWCQQRTGLAVLPVPVALDRFADRRYVRGGWGRFYFPAAPAFHDRHGAAVVKACLAHIDQPCTWRSRRAPVGRFAVGRCEWENLAACEHYWHAIPSDTDVVVLPRRYGGLSLPVQEALAQGIPVVMSDIAPNRSYTELVVPVLPGAATVRMKGGRFCVHDLDPVILAAFINELDTPALKRASVLALEWSERHSWEALLPAYLETLERAYEQRAAR